VTDAKRANRRLQFDWVVEENFVEIPSWHPAVDRVIPVAFRRWRKDIIGTLRNGEFADFKKDLKRDHYDLVIDAQGLIKSGFISRLSKGLTIGLSDSTIKEPLATLFYNKVFSVPRDEHAVQRVRELFSRALNYPLSAEEMAHIDYGLDYERIGLTHKNSSNSALLFLHGTTWQSKHWPVPYWRELAVLATARGYSVRLPWGNDAEHMRAQAIAENIPGVTVLERHNLTGMARQIASADGVVSVDTGLGHLAAALAVPAVSLYGPTNPGLSGTFGQNQLQLSSSIACAPCMNKTCHYQGEPVQGVSEGQPFIVDPPCYSSHPPSQVLAALEGLIAARERTAELS
tara:strand:+ start:811 stop:1842 length:1032 start_codon:yes stop_codon:yes gene_type:complete